jgi:hypothetical protein
MLDKFGKGMGAFWRIFKQNWSPSRKLPKQPDIEQKISYTIWDNFEVSLCKKRNFDPFSSNAAVKLVGL